MKAAPARLAEAGVSASWEPVKLEEDTRAEVKDPDGYAVELREGHLPLRGRG